jgi:hypothetical protein
MSIVKWLLFAMEMVLLWAMCNGLFLVPGPYYGPRGEATAIVGLLAGVSEFVSGRIFQRSSAVDGHSPLPGVLTTPPVVAYVFVLLASAVFMLASTLAVSLGR